MTRLGELQRLHAAFLQWQTFIAGSQLNYQFLDAPDSLQRLGNLTFGPLDPNHAALDLLK